MNKVLITGAAISPRLYAEYIFLSDYTRGFVRKAKILKETGENRFLDPQEWVRFLEFCKERAKKVDPDEKKP